jgi:YD repeat-containing protein
VIYNEAYYEDPASKTDVVKMLGLNPQDVVMTRVPQARWWGGSGAQGDADDLLIRVKGTNDSLRIANFFYDDAAGPYGQAVDRFDFANGQSWSIADVKLAVRAQTNLDDRLVGYAGNDSIEGLQGDDTIYGRGGDDVLDGGLGNDTVEGGDGVDVVRGGAGDDALAGDAGDDALHGGTGKDTLVGGVGDDTLSGDEGNDVLTGGEGNDVLIGGAGDDSLEGGTGSDTYHFGRGSGHDVIYNEAYYEDPASKTDVVKMLGLNPQDVVMTRVPPARWWGALSQDDLLIQIKGTSDSLRIANFFIADSSYGHAIARFDFANGQSLSIADVNLVVLASGGANAPAPVPSTAPTIGDDVLTGTPSADSISGLEGADWVNGDEGDDTLSGGFGNDTLSGGAGDDILNGDAGGDSLSGEAGDDQLFGGEGGDTLHGGQGDDRLDGGAGNDALTGGEGSDTYVFGRGSGNDTLNNYAESEYWRSTQGIPGTSTDTVEMTGLRLSDVGFRRENDDLIVYLKDSPDSLRIQHHFATVNSFYPFAVQRFSFADGVDVGFDYVTQATEVTGAEDDVIWGRHGSDQISGGEGADSINGGSGDDLLDGGAGNDSIEGGAGQDTLSGGSGNDYLVGGADDDFLYGGEGADTIYGSAGNDRIDGGSGDDGLQGGQGSDTYVFGRGYGRDTIYNYSTEEYWSPPSINSVDTVELIGLLPSDIIFGRDGDALLVSIKDSPDSLRILHFFYGDAVEQRSHFYIDKFTFADGSVVGLDFVKQAVQQPSENDDLIFGYASNETLHGAGGGDVIHAEGGDDTLIGGEGDDYLHGGTGSNTYVFGLGDGRDKIAARPVSAENPIFARGTLAFKPGIGPRDVSAHRIGTSLEVRVANSGDRITIEGFFQEGSPLNAANPVQLITFADGTKWDLVEMFAPRVDRSFFDESGRLTGHLDSSGFLTHNTYDGLGRLVKTTTFATRALGNPDVWETARLEDLLPPASASDKSTVYLFNAKNQKVAEIDAEGYLSENVFDLAGNVRQTVRYASRLEDSAIATVLASLTLEAGAGTLLSTIRPTAAAQDQVRTFEYDALHRLKKETGIDGSVSETFYDLAGNVVQSIKAQGTSESRSILAKFDLLGRLTGELSPAGAALVNGNLTDVEIDAVWAEHGISHQYDAAGLRVRTTSKVGSIHYLYDADGRIAVEVNALGEVKESSYDVFGQRVRLTAYAQRVDTAQLVGGLLSSPANAGTVAALATAKAASSANSVTQYEYDAAGRLTKTIDAEGVIVTHIYNAFGEEVERISGIAAGRDLHELMTYDLRGQRITTQLDPSGANVVSVNAYDAFGRLIRSVDGNGNERTRTYDRLGRIITQTEPQGMGGNAAVVLSSSYDAFGRVLSQTDGLGHTTQYSYNDAARSVTVTTPEGITVTTARNAFGQTSSVTDGRGNTTSYQYDLNGNLVQTSTALGQSNNTYDAANRLIEAQDANGNRVSYSYDAANRLLSRTVDPQGLALTTQYVYDAKGQQISVIDPNSNRTDIEYDRKGQVLSRTVDPEGLALRTSYAHDGRGNVVNVTQPDGSTTQYNYDALGRREREIVDPNGLALVKTYQYDGNGNVISSVDANGHTTRYVYDAQDQLVYTIDPLGQVQSQVYDAAGRVVQVRQHAGTVGLGLMAGVPTVAQIQALLGTNAQDRVEYRQYDRDNRLLSTVNGLGEVTTYSYDNNGNVLQQRRHAQRIDFVPWAATWTPGYAPPAVVDNGQDIVVTKTYDALNRLSSSVNGLGETTTYAYDANGNLTETINAKGQAGASTYVYGPDNRLLMSTGPDGQRRWFMYDAAGRKAAEIDADGALTEYRYNSTNLVTKVTTYAQAVNVELLTDASGRPTTGFNANPLNAPSGCVTLEMLRPTASSADSTTWSVYDRAGVLTAQIDGIGHVKRLERDGAHRLVGSTDYAQLIDVSLLGDGTGLKLSADNSELIILGASSQQVVLLTPSVGLGADREQTQVRDRAGQLIATIDAHGYLTENRYDASGRLVQTVAYGSPVVGFPDQAAFAAKVAAAQHGGALGPLLPASSDQDLVTHFYYDHLGQRVGEVDPEGFLTETVYDLQGRVLEVVRYATKIAGTASVESALAELRPSASAQDHKNTSQWNALGLLTQRVNEERTGTSYQYDLAGRAVVVAQGASQGAERSSIVRRDAYGRVVAELSAEGAALLASAPDIEAVWSQHATKYAWDASGQRTASIDPNGLKTVYLYDGEGRLRYTVNANGEVTERSYDTSGRLVQTAAYAQRVDTAQLVGGLLSSPANAGTVAALATAKAASSANSVTQYEYDAAGRLTKTIDAEGVIVTHIYNAFGEEVERISGIAAGRDLHELMTYDLRGQRITTQLDPSGANVVSVNAYDAFGRLIRSVDGNGNERTRTYDRLGRIITQTEPQGMGGNAAVVLSSSYDAFGRVLSQTDGLGHTTQYSYNDAARSVTVTTPEGITVTTARNAFGQTSSVTDGRGNTTSYQYDLNGNLVQTSTALGQSNNTYDAANRLIEAQDANGNRVSYSYDAANRLLSRTVDPQGLALTTQYVYDAKGQQISVIDPNSNRTDIEYDRKGQVLSRTVDPEGLALRTSYAHDGRGNVVNVTQPDGSTTQYNYDALGRREREIVDPNGLALVKTYQYDGNGNVISSVDANGHTTRYVYDAQDQLVYTIDPLGQVQSQVYDAAGRVVQVRQHAGTVGLGLMAGVPTVAQIQALLGTNAQDRVEYRQYDRDNRLLSTVNGLGEVTTYSYDNNGNVLQQRRHAQRIDFATWSPGTTPAVGIDPLHDQLAEHVFDAANRLVSTRNALGESTTFVYDNVGNLLSKAIGGYSETYRYDAAYRLTLAIDAVGAAKQFEYDAGGRITKETRYANLSNAAVNEGIPLEVSARDQVLRYAYDTAGRQRFVVSGSGAVTESRFDARGQVVQQTKYLQRVALPGILSEQAVAAAITTDANDRTEHFAYDAAGRQRFAIDGNGAVSETVYDAQGNVIQRIRRANQAFAPGAVTPSAQDRIQFYAYDAAGRQTSQVDELGGFVAFSYDAKGNLVRRHEYATRVTPPIGAWSAAMLPVASEHDRVLVQTYDAENRAVFSIDAAGAVTRQEYDAFGLLRVRTAYANTLSASVVSALQPTTGFAQFLQLVPPSDDDRTTLDSYDAAGRLRVSVDAAGYLTSREYDGVGRLIKVTQHSQPVTQIPSSSTAQEIFNTLPVEHSTDQIVSYGLDALGRLLSMQRNGTSMEVNTYDGLGNLLLRADANGAERTFDYDSDGNLIAQWDPEVTVGSVVLDANGNLHQGPAVTDRPLTRFTYDGAGQLTHKLEAAGRPEARTTEYAYDAAGHRTKTTLPPVAVMDAAAMAQLLGSGASSATRNEQLLTLTTQTVYNAFGEAVVLVDTAGVATHRAYDQRGQLRFEVDALGYLTENTYDRFGNISAVIRYAEPHGVVETGQTVSASALAESAAALQSSKDRVVETAYDQRNRVISVTQSAVWANDGVTGSGRMERPVTKYVYDTFGQKTQERQLLNEGSDSWVIQHFDYDIRGNQVRSLDALGYVTSREFDAFGNVIAVTEYAEPWDEQAGTLPAINERDRTTRYTYDAHNRKTSETRVNVQYSVASDGTVTTSGLTTTYTYDAVGNLLSTTDPLDHTSQTTYDALGRVTSTSGAQAASVSFVRDAVGNVIALNQGDRVTLTMYDSHGRAIQIAKADSVNEFRSYDARGLLGRSWQSVGSEESGTQVLFTAYQYDALGRRTHVISPASSSALSVSNAALAVQQSAGMVVQDLEYNAFGEVISKGTNGYAEREKYAYDNAGRLVHSYASRGQDSDAGGIWQFQLYDLLGRQTASIASDGSTYLSGALDSAAMDAMGHSGVRRTDFVLDALGRTIEARLAQRQDAVTQQSGQPVIHQTFDRWGNLLSQSDPRSSAWVTRYQYNAFNQIVRQEQPEVGTLDAIGNAFSVTPTKHFYYDAAGREVAQRDANGNLTGKTLDAYGRILEERHADGGVVRYSYNAFDQRVSVTDAMGHTTTYGYDQAGRQTLIITSPVETHEASGADIVSQGSIQLVTRMVYDQAGRMISKTNGADEKETYRYDARGNIIATTRPLGEVTQAAYDSQGRQVAYQNANGDTVISNVDYFGRLNSRTDLAGVATQFDRDFAGQVVSQVSGRGQNLAYQYDAAGNLLHITDAGTNKQSHYAYDAAGARIFEQTVQNGTTLQQQTLAYDSHGRLALIEAMDGVRITRDYDAQGNVLRQQVQSGVPLPSTTEGLQLTEVGKAWTQVGTKTVPVLDPVTGKPKIDPATGQVITRQEPVYGWKPFKELRNQITTEEGTRSTQTQWFAYDSMNRQILVDGAVNGNAQDQANLTADQGHILTYDLNGNRTSDTHFGRQVVQADRQYARDENGNILLDANGNPQYGYTSDRENEGAGNTGGSPASAQALGSSYFKAQLGAVTQTYTYDAANRLKTVSHQTVDEQGQASGNTYLLDTRQYDAAGRLVQSGPAGGLDAGFVTALTGEELNASGLVTKKSFYDDNGRLVQQKVLKADGSRSYDVYYDSLDAEGNVLQYRVVDENDVTQTYTKTYEKRDSYLEASIHGVRSDNEERPSDSTSSYDVNGHLTQVSETDWPEDDAEAQSPGANLERQFETDANGIVLRKTQEGHILKQLIVSGQVMTAYGKGTDPAKQLTDDGKPNYIAQGEFGATYEGIDNRYNSGASSYTVQSGDTLAGIARTLWGDASLWWKLADVNGLAAQGPDSRLAEGQSLSIPGHVSGVHNNAQTHKPYDPTEVVGDTTPNMPAPPVDEGGGCGILGKIIMIVVAVAVTAVTGGAGGAVSNFWGGLLGQGSAAAAAATGATAAAAGSVASQAVGVAIGAQSKFSWKNVALAAVSGGVSGGLGTVDFTGSGELGSLGNTVIRSALGNTISQGIGVATGLQKSFDWKSVAGAAVGAGVGWGVGQALGSNANTLAGASLRSFAAGTATALVRGGKISITQVAVDAFGSALGDGLGDTLRAGLGQSQSQENSPQFMEGSAGGGGNGSYQPDNGPDWGGMGTGTGRWTAEPAGQPTLTAGDFARMDRASEEVWAAQGGAWEQRPGTAATDRAFLEAFQNPMAPVGEGVLMAAGPGYSGGLELRDRLTLRSREDNSLFEEASALAANALQADNRRAAWVQTQAQAASAQYAQGYGNVRDTSPAAGLMVNPETGLADFRYTSQALNSQADGAYRPQIGGSDGITGPSIGSLSANSGTGSYDNPRAWIGNEVIVRERAESMLPEDLRRFELEQRNSFEPNHAMPLMDTARPYASMTALTEAGILDSRAGQALQGAGKLALDTWTALPQLGLGAIALAGDGVGYARAAIAPQRSVLTGQAFPYQPQSKLLQSIESQGVLGTIGGAITGTVRSAPGIGLIGALGTPNRDWQNIGAQAAGSVGFAAVGALRGVRGGVEGANTVGEIGPAARIHPEYWASVSGEVNLQSSIRALRANGSPEALATAKLIKRGDVEVAFKGTDPYGQGAWGRKPWSSNTVEIYLDQVTNPTQSAGIIAHETKHVLQRTTPSTHLKDHEVEAYLWQRAADVNYRKRSSVDSIIQYVDQDPDGLYKAYPWAPNSPWRP